ncbi:hypothetical protein PGB90_008527 [Kerria lacca]
MTKLVVVSAESLQYKQRIINILNCLFLKYTVDLNQWFAKNEFKDNCVQFREQKSTKDKNDDSSSNRKKPNNTKNNKKNDKIRYNVPEVCGFDKGLEAEKILGATDNDGLTFLIKWKGTTETELVPARIARYKCPHLVIKFFEKHITWHNISNNINL